MRYSTLIGIVAAATSCSAIHAQQGARSQLPFSWTGQLSSGATLTIKNINGPIDVVAASGSRVSVRATTDNGRSDSGDYTVEVDDHGTDVSICTVYRGTSACSDRGDWSNTRTAIRYTVEIPSSVALHVATGNGAISITRAGATVTAETGNGRVTIGATNGQVTASSGNGDITVQSARGPVKVNTGNGRVSVTTSEGPVTARTGNGDIDVVMSAVRGDENMTFSSGSGSIHVTVPATFNGQLDAETGNGSLTSDFPITMSGRLDTHHLHGAIGTGNGPLIKIETGNGRIEFRKG